MEIEGSQDAQVPGAAVWRAEALPVDKWVLNIEAHCIHIDAQTCTVISLTRNPMRKETLGRLRLSFGMPGALPFVKWVLMA